MTTFLLSFINNLYHILSYKLTCCYYLFLVTVISYFFKLLNVLILVISREET